MSEMRDTKQALKSYAGDIIAFTLLFVILYLYFNRERLQDEGALFTVPDAWLDVNTIFLSIVLEAAPFLLLGVFVSALIQIYVKEDTLQKYIPKNAYAALIPAAMLGAIFPICECAIIPVVRRLIKKGMPLHVGVVFLVGAPILNPVVAASTYYAFRTDLTVLYARMGLAFVLAIIIGAIIYLLFKNSHQLKEQVSSSVQNGAHSHGHGHNHAHSDEHHHHDKHKHYSKQHHKLQQQKRPLAERLKEAPTKIKETLYHAGDEFIDMGKFLIIGAFVAAMFQTFLDRQILLAIGSDVYSSTLVMMAFAYVLSLCSEADAFVAASFGSTFTIGSIIAFLVYGPMLDLKNTIMLFAFFKVRFVLAFIATVTVVVFASVVLLSLFIL